MPPQPAEHSPGTVCGTQALSLPGLLDGAAEPGREWSCSPSLPDLQVLQSEASVGFAMEEEMEIPAHGVGRTPQLLTVMIWRFSTTTSHFLPCDLLPLAPWQGLPTISSHPEATKPSPLLQSWTTRSLSWQKHQIDFFFSELKLGFLTLLQC